MKFSQILENTNVYWKHRLAIEPRGNVLINIYIISNNKQNAKR